MDHIEIDPRYPGRSQTKLLSKVIRSSQYDLPTITSPRTSIYRQLNSEVSKSISRKSRYQVGASPDLNEPLSILQAKERPRDTSSGRPVSSRRSRHYNESGYPSPSTSGGNFNSHRTSTHERTTPRRSRHQANGSPEIAGILLPVSSHHPRLAPSSERGSHRRSKYSPSVSPDSKPGKNGFRTRSSSNASQNHSTTELDSFNSPLEDSPEDLFDNDSTDNTKEEEDFVVAPPPTQPLTEVGDYSIIRDIGQGTFGVVKLGEHKLTKQKVAIKVITKSSIKNARAQARVEQELRLLPLLDHPHVVKVFDVIEDDERFMIIMEHLTGGELFQYIIKNRRVNERESRFFFRQILSALDYCHQNSIIHRDMKPENLLFDSSMQIRLIDFGFANFYESNSTLSTFCGSPYYASPEMIRGVDYVGPEVDIWSLGVTLYTMLSGKLPFNAYNLKSFQRKVTRGEYEIPVYFSREVADLIRCMLNTDRRKRMTMEQIRLHAWTNLGYSDLPNSYLTIRPLTVRNPNIETLKLMKAYGFEPDAARTILITNNKTVQPVFSLYYLLEAARCRQLKELEKKEKLRVRSLNTKVISTGAPPEGVVPFEQPSSHTDNEEPEMIQIIPSRRHSVDTMRDEDFEGEIPLAQTPLKVAGRSFDSISRRCSVQSKLKPVGLASKFNNHEPTGPGGELGMGLLGKEPKDGWFIGLFNVSVTSSKPFQQIVQELERVLNNLKIAYQATESRFVCHSPASKLSFEVRIQWKDSQQAFVVQFKNLKGSSWAHKKYCYKIIQRMFI